MTKKRKGGLEIEKSFDRNFHHWRHLKASVISRHDVEKLHAEIAKNRGKYAANRAVELLRAIYNKANQWKTYNGENPASGITEFKEQKRDRILKPDEFARFFRALDDEEQDFKDFVILALLTGQRKSNVLAMSWDQIDHEGGTWTIPGEQMKNEQSLSIKLTEIERQILKRRSAKKGAFVFPGSGRTGHLVEPKRAWARLLRRAGIENLHIHDLRRSLASYMASSGAELAVIKNALNHKDVKTTIEVYAKTAKDAEMDARQKAHNMIFRFGNVEGDEIVAGKAQ
ncbi:MAG: site-specific integrase [Cyanobacteria bacterium]|nr:site-specific integrase [Cyanobacteriota bacterium]